MFSGEKLLKKRLYPRDVLNYVMEILSGRRTLLIVGGRRVGKTSLLYLIAQELISSGKEKVFYFDLEFPDDLDLVARGPEDLRNIYGGGIYLIDEIQYLPRADKFIKLIVDHFPDIKLVCSGSSSIAIYRKFQDSLIGRIHELELYPLNFREYLRFRGYEEYTYFLPEWDLFSDTPPITSLPDVIHREYLLYLKNGGYPEVVLTGSSEEKVRFISQIFSLYAKRDLREVFALRKETEFEKFFMGLAGTVGGLCNLNEICRDAGIQYKTGKQYLFLLKELFLVKVLTPMTFNVRDAIRKMPKVYFTDTGLLNWARGTMLQKRPDGSVLENAVYVSILRRLTPFDRLYFFHKKHGGEVDFVIKRGEKILPIEVKLSEKITPSFRNFIKREKPERGIVVTPRDSGLEYVDKTPVYFVPASII